MTEVAEDRGNLAVILAREGVDSADGLLEKHRAGVWRTAYRFLRNTDDALDVTQDVLLKLHQSLASLDAQTRLPAWLMRVTANMSLNFLRQGRTRRRYHLAAGLEAPARSAPQAGSGLGEALAAALASLPRGQRAVVTLRLLEEKTFGEIAEAFQVNASTVKVQFARGVRRLRAELQDWI